MEMQTWTEFKKELLKNKKFAEEYAKLEPEFELAKTLIKKRLEKGMTQQQLAKKIGTKQEAISRLESGSYNPSMLLLRKVAKALDSRLEVTIK
ncbi:MAG: helix-turn-helix transcriptional regulator [Minisyncoccales bacterium]